MNNVYRYYGSGGNNKAYVYIYTSNAVVELKQTGGANEANLTVSGDSIYDYKQTKLTLLQLLDQLQRQDLKYVLM